MASIWNNKFGIQGLNRNFNNQGCMQGLPISTTGVIRYFFLVLCVHYVYISGMINTEKRIKDAIKYAKLHPVKKDANC